MPVEVRPVPLNCRPTGMSLPWPRLLHWVEATPISPPPDVPGPATGTGNYILLVVCLFLTAIIAAFILSIIVLFYCWLAVVIELGFDSSNESLHSN